MHISKQRIKQFNLAIAFFLAFAGFYVVIMVMANLGMRDATRILTIPMRILIVGCLGLAFINRPRIKIQNGLFFFLIFSFFYYMRIVFELLKGSSSFHIPVFSFFLYFTSFVFLPMLFVSQLQLTKKDYTLLFNTIIVSCLIMAIGTYFYYGNLIGDVSRLTPNVSETSISPLALSYTATLGIGIGISYLLTNKVEGLKKIIIYSTIVLCLIPFFLGASRGSIIALFIPFIFHFLFQKGLKRKMAVITALAAIAIGFIIAAQYLGLGVFNRFININEAIESGSQAALRIDIWQSSWSQFLKNPWLGNSLEATDIGFYPHNILLESLITTGFFGFFFYSSFLFLVLKKSVWIIKEHPSYLFIVVIFLQAFSQNMFSGSLYGTSWLAISAALIINFNKESV
jgi:O-antigen ligase